MFGRSRRTDSDTEHPVLSIPSPEVVPWQGEGGLRGKFAPIAVGRKGRLIPGVLLTVGEVAAQLRLDELRAMLAGKTGIVESVQSEPLTFLARPRAAAPSSAAAEWTSGLPDEALVLLVAPMHGPPAAVLNSASVTGFSEWVRALPA